MSSKYTHHDLHVNKRDPDMEPAKFLHKLWCKGWRISVVLHLQEMTADRPGYGIATTAYFARELSAADLEIFHSLLPEDA